MGENNAICKARSFAGATAGRQNASMNTGHLQAGLFSIPGTFLLTGMDVQVFSPGRSASLSTKQALPKVRANNWRCAGVE
jgi:hypothetical protein